MSDLGDPGTPAAAGGEEAANASNDAPVVTDNVDGFGESDGTSPDPANPVEPAAPTVPEPSSNKAKQEFPSDWKTILASLSAWYYSWMACVPVVLWVQPQLDYFDCILNWGFV